MPIEIPNLSESVAEFLSAAELEAADTMRAFGSDPFRDYHFWEAVVCRILDGEKTPHGEMWDVELAVHGGQKIRVEVKHSAEFCCLFSNGARNVFKFASPLGTARRKTCDVVVLIGIDALSSVHTWVLPAKDLKDKCKSITITSPRARVGVTHQRYGLDRFRCPPSQLLPEVLRASRPHIESTAATRHARRFEKTRTNDLFDQGTTP